MDYTEFIRAGELRLDYTKNDNYNLRGQLTFNRFLDKDNVHQVTASAIGELSSGLYGGS